MASNSDTLVTVATYNEIENLPRLADEIFEFLPSAHLLVIDDNSPDGTGDWCDTRAKTDDRVHCLHRSGKLGLGTASIAGMKYGIEHDYRYVLNMDADFSHHPRHLPSLVARMEKTGEECDVAIGSRYCPGGGIDGWPWHRHFMSQGVNFYARWLMGLTPGDCSGAYRCFRVETLKKLDFEKIWSTGYSFQEEILWRLKLVGARFAEVPITFVDREKGQSKIHAGEAVSALWIIFRLGITNWVGI